MFGLIYTHNEPRPAGCLVECDAVTFGRSLQSQIWQIYNQGQEAASKFSGVHCVLVYPEDGVCTFLLNVREIYLTTRRHIPVFFAVGTPTVKTVGFSLPVLVQRPTTRKSTAGHPYCIIKYHFEYFYWLHRLLFMPRKMDA